MIAKILPSLALFFDVQCNARKISKLIEASSKKSMLSAKREVAWILRATKNSTKNNLN